MILSVCQEEITISRIVLPTCHFFMFMDGNTSAIALPLLLVLGLPLFVFLGLVLFLRYMKSLLCTHSQKQRCSQSLLNLQELKNGKCSRNTYYMPNNFSALYNSDKLSYIVLYISRTSNPFQQNMFYFDNFCIKTMYASRGAVGKYIVWSIISVTVWQIHTCLVSF